MNGTRAAAFLSDSAGHRFGRASLCVRSWGMLGLGAGAPKPAQGLQWSQHPSLGPQGTFFDLHPGLTACKPGMILV